MNANTSLLLALLAFAAGCSTWVPAKTVTLRDVDPELAHAEGSDLRYRASAPPTCPGMHGCRDVATESEAIATYKWDELCDGRFCGTDELLYVELTREAALVAFTAEQVVAASDLLSRRDTVGDDRLRLETFVSGTMATLADRIDSTEAALARLPVENTFSEQQMRRDAANSVARARQYIGRARSVLARRDASTVANR